MAIREWIKHAFNRQKITEPAPAYDTWSAAYDHQPGNLMLDLDAGITGAFLDTATLRGKVLVDVGCGTGRHWKQILSYAPARLVGYDVSAGMLGRLRDKFPGAETFLLKGNRLEGLANASADLVISTLTVAHISDIGNAFSEWDRVLRPGGEVFITDYHPDALDRGGQRTFKHEGKLVAVRNHVHSIGRIRALAGQLGWKELRFTERTIDDKVKEYYGQQDALPVFEKFKGTRIIYGIHLKKNHDPA